MHPVQRIQNVGHDVQPVDLDRAAIKVAQGGVQYRAALGFVDLFARKHRIAPGRQPGIVTHGNQRGADVAVNLRLGIVKQHIAGRGREPRSPVRVGVKQVQNIAVRASRRQCLQALKIHSKSLRPMYRHTA